MVWDFWSLRPESLHQVGRPLFFTMLPDKELLIMPHVVFSSFGYFIGIDVLLSFGEPSSDFLVLEEFYNDDFIHLSPFMDLT